MASDESIKRKAVAACLCTHLLTMKMKKQEEKEKREIGLEDVRKTREFLRENTCAMPTMLAEVLK